MKKLLMVLFLIIFKIFSTFSQDTYKPYFEGYLDKKPYHQRTPYALKNYSQVVENMREMEYYIDVLGTLQPMNDEIIIENIGDEEIINPRITINDKWNWYDSKSIMEEVVRDSKTDKEKAISIWQFVHKNRIHWQPPGGDNVDDPVKGLNIYGHFFCGSSASITSILAKMAGLNARTWGLSGHVVSEIFYEGGWHILDSDCGVFYLNKDNKTIAGIDELIKNPWLIDRTFHPGLAGWKQAHPRRTSTGAWSENVKTVMKLYTTTENNKISEVSLNSLYEIKLTLRPGEKVIYRWDNIGKYHNNFLYNESPIYANGKIIYNPDYTNNSYRKWILSQRNIKSIGDDGLKPNIHIDSCITERTRSRFQSYIIYKVTSPYVIVGGKIGGDFYKNDTYGDVCQMEISFDGNEWIPVWNAKKTGWIKHNQEIDDIICPVGRDAKYEYYVKVKFVAAGTGLDFPMDPGDNTQAGMDNLTIETDFQVSPFSIPELSLGKNKIKYFDQSNGKSKVKITHRWYQRENNRYPEPPSDPLSPRDGAVVNGMTPILKWKDAVDPDKNDTIVDYHIQLSDRADCKWALSPNFDVDMGYNLTEWKVPESWLNPSQTYYWRVKAKDKNGNWSKYSKIWSFKTK